MSNVSLWADFMGVSTLQVAADFLLWGRFLDTYPLRCLIELGTGAGGMSMWFALQCRWRGIAFTTWDHQKWHFFDRFEKTFGFPVEFLQGDVFTKGKTWLAELLEKDVSYPVILFCDDGSKPREFNELGELLRNGDYLAVHDRGAEFKPEDICLPVEMLMQRDCEALGGITRWFRKVEQR